MEQILVNGVPLSETFGANDKSDLLKSEKRRKFIMVHDNRELHITACAVSQNVDELAMVDADSDFFVEPNQQWTDWAEAVMECPEELCLPARPERAWVKVYRVLNPKTDSVIAEQVQSVKIPMSFLGESSKECWAEIQLMIKKQVIINGHLVNLNAVKLGRHKCYDTRVGQWVLETEPIEPKIKKDEDGNVIDDPKNKSHYYIALRLYHKEHRPENQRNWRFEPVYAAIANDFYRIDAWWENEVITITASPLSKDSSEIPDFLRQ